MSNPSTTEGNVSVFSYPYRWAAVPEEISYIYHNVQQTFQLSYNELVLTWLVKKLVWPDPKDNLEDL